jgi:TRAP-type uncharacterized transport system fused permease subunit
MIVALNKMDACQYSESRYNDIKEEVSSYLKKVGYKPQTAGAIEAAASSGGQILPPIMGAGAFIMSEITGIAYSEIVIAAIIPALLYFVSVYFNVDLAAQKYDMKGIPRDQLPKFSKLARQA